MNFTQTVWYWKKFYWKVFATFDIACSAAVIAGMATAGPDVFNTLFAQRLIFWLSVQMAGVKAVDALIDQTFQTLSNGNGNGHTAVTQTTVADTHTEVTKTSPLTTPPDGGTKGT